MPDEYKNFGGSLVLEFRKWWRYVNDLYLNFVVKRGTSQIVEFSVFTSHVIL